MSINEVEEPKTGHKFTISLYIINVSLSIIRIILEYIDKKELNLMFGMDILVTILLIIVLSLNLFIIGNISKIIFFTLLGMLWMANNIVPFFAYTDTKNYDHNFYVESTYMAGFRILSVFAYISFSMAR